MLQCTKRGTFIKAKSYKKTRKGRAVIAYWWSSKRKKKNHWFLMLMNLSTEWKVHQNSIRNVRGAQINKTRLIQYKKKNRVTSSWKELTKLKALTLLIIHYSTFHELFTERVILQGNHRVRYSHIKLTLTKK